MADVSRAWNGVIGQSKAVSLLRSAIGAPVHAYLFLGPEGVGKRECARIFAAGLLSDGFAAPDAGRVMRLAEGEQLADLVVIEPEGRQLLAGDARRAIYEAGQQKPANGGNCAVSEKKSCAGDFLCWQRHTEMRWDTAA